MNKNKKIILGVVGVLILVGVFYAGMSYGQNSASASNVTGMNKTGQFGMRGNRINGGGFTSGQIIAKDANSITVQIINGDPNTTNTTGTGSKIIFLDGNTTITKMASGSMTDLINGTAVSITGNANPDGSITAKSIQIRPQMKTNMPIPK